jgi:hypothetical protein
MKAYVFALSGLLLLNSCLVFGQTATTQITGAVTDPTGASIVEAAVTVTNSDTGATREATTNTAGYYTVAFLLPGKYDITIRKEGFETAHQTGLILQVERVARVDFTLSLGALTQTIEVSAKGDLVQSSTAELGTVVSEKEVTDLPLNGRNFTELLKLQAGVTPLNVSQGGSTGNHFQQ